MKHRYRFLAERQKAGLWRLAAEEAHHLTKVLRLGLDDEVELTDGQGLWAYGHVSEIGRQEVLVRVAEEMAEPPHELSLQLVLACMKPHVFEDLLPSLVELGVDVIHIFPQVHTDKKWLAEKVQSRWQRLSQTALKQCKRSFLPLLHVHASLSHCLQALPPSSDRMLLDPNGSVSLMEIELASPSACVFAVGSEKGFTAEEAETLQANGFQSRRMGTHILRAYTACLAATAILAGKRELTAVKKA